MSDQDDRRGLSAPDGYLWARGRSGAWRFLRAAELVQAGKAGNVRSVCGLWASLLPGQDGWQEVVQRVTPEPRRLCQSCLASVADAQRRDTSVTPAVEQAKLF